MATRKILVNDVLFNLKVHKHRQDSGELTLTVVFKRYEKKKSPNFFYSNNGRGKSVFRFIRDVKGVKHDNEYRGKTLKECKQFVVEYLLNNKLC